MRQRRLHRLSTFVDEQSNLSKERQKENKPQDIATPRTSKEAATQPEKIIKTVRCPGVSNYENKIVKVKKLETDEISGRETLVMNKTTAKPGETY